MAAPARASAHPIESAFLVRGDVSPEVIAKSLQALIPTRHHPIARHEFTVLDTFDGRVRRAGTRLIRSGANGGSTVAFRPRGGASQLTLELKQPVSFAWDLPEGPLQQGLSAVIGVRRLLPQVQAEEYGSLLEMLDERGKIVARLRIESGRARLPFSGRSWQQLPTVITLTGLRGYEEAYRRLVPLIESRPGLESCPEGFHGLMLRAVGVEERRSTSAPDVALPPSIGADAGARKVHLALLEIVTANEPGVRTNLDTEFLHDFRVAIRRTRALLGQIKQVFAPETAEHFATELSWIGRITGPARDMDVLVLSLRAQPMDGVTGAEVDALRTLLRKAQREEHRRLLEALDSERYQRLVAEWKAFLEQTPEAGPRNAALPLIDVIAARAWKLSRRIAAAAATIDDHTSAERLHEIRIDAKKLRYLTDVAPAFYDAADLARILGALKKAQRALGDFNDAYVQEQRLLECGRTAGGDAPAAALLALGRLAEQSRQRRERLREPVVDALTEFGAHGTRSAFRRAFKRERRPEPAR
jgi:CHAD domain-containing protein